MSDPSQGHGSIGDKAEASLHEAESLMTMYDRGAISPSAVAKALAGRHRVVLNGGHALAVYQTPRLRVVRDFKEAAAIVDPDDLGIF